MAVKNQEEEEKEEDLTELPPNEGVDEEDLEGAARNEDEDKDREPEDIKESDDSGPELEDSQNGEDESSEQREHTIEDLASEADESSLSGVEPSKPRSFNMEEESKFSSINNSQIPSSGVYSSNRGANKKGLPKTVLLLIIALLVIGGSVYLLKSKFKGSQENASPSPSLNVALESPSPTPSPSPSIDRSKYKIRVLNGTTTSGLAASVSAKLVSLGYTADKTANATNSAFTQTQVRAKPSVATLLITQLIRDLSPDFDAASSSSSLKESDSADAEVILGTR